MTTNMVNGLNYSAAQCELRCKHNLATGRIVKVKRSTLKPGQFFSATGAEHCGLLFPCIALDSKDVSQRLKKKYWGGANHLWQVYIPAGQLSWSSADNDCDVYVAPQ